MKNTLQTPSLLTLFASSAALGALAMFAFDPSKGRRRRALLRDKTRRSIASTAHALQVSARDLGHRAHGLQAAARHLLTGRRAPDDLVLIERVRAKMGRVVSHPHAIQIGAHNGRVTLSGPILPGEAGPLLDLVRSVWGVRHIEDHLVVYDRPDSIPSLQGGVQRNAVRAQNARHEWRPVWRIAALCAAGALAVCATRSRGAARLVFAMAGASLATRGTANMPLARLGRPMRRARNGEHKRPHALLAHDRMRNAPASTAVNKALH